MARPKKGLSSPTTKDRLVGSFWKLLETNRPHDISVRMVAVEARCNRSTLYYHFDDLNALASFAMESEFLVDSLFLDGFFRLAFFGDESLLASAFAALHIKRLGLILDGGDEGLFDATVKTAIIDKWTLVIRPDDSPLSAEGRILIEFTISGLLGLLAYCAYESRSESPMTVLAKCGFLKDVASTLIDGLEETEGLMEAGLATALNTAKMQQ